jgi:hypothetical protein
MVEFGLLLQMSFIKEYLDEGLLKWLCFELSFLIKEIISKEIIVFLMMAIIEIDVKVSKVRDSVISHFGLSGGVVVSL